MALPETSNRDVFRNSKRIKRYVDGKPAINAEDLGVDSTGDVYLEGNKFRVRREVPSSAVFDGDSISSLPKTLAEQKRLDLVGASGERYPANLTENTALNNDVSSTLGGNIIATAQTESKSYVLTELSSGGFAIKVYNRKTKGAITAEDITFENRADTKYWALAFFSGSLFIGKEVNENKTIEQISFQTKAINPAFQPLPAPFDATSLTGVRQNTFATSGADTGITIIRRGAENENIPNAPETKADGGIAFIDEYFLVGSTRANERLDINVYSFEYKAHVANIVVAEGIISKDLHTVTTADDSDILYVGDQRSRILRAYDITDFVPVLGKITIEGYAKYFGTDDKGNVGAFPIFDIPDFEADELSRDECIHFKAVAAGGQSTVEGIPQDENPIRVNVPADSTPAFLSNVSGNDFDIEAGIYLVAINAQVTTNTSAANITFDIRDAESNDVLAESTSPSVLANSTNHPIKSLAVLSLNKKTTINVLADTRGASLAGNWTASFIDWGAGYSTTSIASIENKVGDPTKAIITFSNGATSEINLPKGDKGDKGDVGNAEGIRSFTSFSHQNRPSLSYAVGQTNNALYRVADGVFTRIGTTTIPKPNAIVYRSTTDRIIVGGDAGSSDGKLYDVVLTADGNDIEAVNVIGSVDHFGITGATHSIVTSLTEHEVDGAVKVFATIIWTAPTSQTNTAPLVRAGLFDVTDAIDSNTGMAVRVGTVDNFGIGETAPSGTASRGGKFFMVGTTHAYLSELSITTSMATRIGNAIAFGVNETSPQGLTDSADGLQLLGAQTDAIYPLSDTTGAAGTKIGSATQFGVSETAPTGIVTTHPWHAIQRDTDRFVRLAATGERPAEDSDAWTNPLPIYDENAAIRDRFAIAGLQDKTIDLHVGSGAISGWATVSQTNQGGMVIRNRDWSLSDAQGATNYAFSLMPSPIQLLSGERVEGVLAFRIPVAADPRQYRVLFHPEGSDQTSPFLANTARQLGTDATWRYYAFAEEIGGGVARLDLQATGASAATDSTFDGNLNKEKVFEQVTDILKGGSGISLQGNTTDESVTINKAVASQSLTSGATIAWNVSNGDQATLTLGHNATITLTGGSAGQFAVLQVTQDATGGRTLTFGSTQINGDTTASKTSLLLFYRLGSSWLFINEISPID